MDAGELGRLLKGARSRIDPGDWGFPPREERRGRRVTGLSQGQVDHLLIQRSWPSSRSWPSGTFGRLERGRMDSPSPALLDDVATLLRLDQHEWTCLYLYAGVERGPQPFDPQAPVRVGHHWQAALDGIEHMAYITDPSWRLLRWNKHFPGLFSAEPDPPRPPENILRWMMLSAQAREILLDWDKAWAPYALAQLRATVRQHPQSQELKRLEAEILADPDTGPIYRNRDREYTTNDGDRRPLRHEVLGEGMVSMCPAHLGSRAVLMIIPFEPGVVEPPKNHGRLLGPSRALSADHVIATRR